MQQYLETLFRRKVLILTPIIVIPLLAMVVTFYTGRAFTLHASVWVEQTEIVNTGPGTGRVTPNVVEAIRINDRLRTEAFTLKVMDRSGLTEAIRAGAWPQPTRLQNQLSSNPFLFRVGRALRMTPPSNVDEALFLGLVTVSESISARDVGDNLVVVSYQGTEPVLGQRLIEETLNLHQEEDLDNRIRETEAGMERLARELQNQEEKLSLAVERLNRFEEQFPPPPAGLLRPVEETSELQRLKQDVDIDQSRYLMALESLENLRQRSDEAITYSDLTFRVIDSPEAIDPGPARISPRRLVLMGMMGGVLATMLSGVTLVLITWRDKSIRTRSNVEKAINTPLIVEMPLIPQSSSVSPLLIKSTVGIKPKSQQ